jgi:hypothetical protein
VADVAVVVLAGLESMVTDGGAFTAQEKVAEAESEADAAVTLNVCMPTVRLL